MREGCDFRGLGGGAGGCNTVGQEANPPCSWEIYGTFGNYLFSRHMEGRSSEALPDRGKKGA
jgi:hypothetical protein